MPHTTTRLLSVVFILWVPWQLMMAQVADDHVLPAWTQLPLAQADYVPPDYRVIEFPETPVGLVYLASKNERTGVWERKRDGYDLWNADSMGDCVLANAKGRVAIPNSHPLILELTLSDAKDLSFLDEIPADAFVAIDAHYANGSLENLRRLLARQAEQIRFPGRIDLTDAELSTLPAPQHLKFPFAGRPFKLDGVLSKTPGIVRMQTSLPLAPAWVNHPSMQHVHIAMSLSGDSREVLQYEHESLAVIASMPNLRELMVQYESGTIDEERIAPLTKLTKLEAIDVKLPGNVASDPPLDRNGAIALSRIPHLRHVDFFTIAEEAYPILEDMPLTSMSIRYSGSDIALFNRLVVNQNLKHLPHFAIPAEALKPLAGRHDLLSISLTAPDHATPQSSDPVYEEIVRANPNLRSLRLCRIAVDKGLAAAILNCSRLESLELDEVVILDHVDFEGTLSTLTKLVIRESPERPAPLRSAIALKCPDVVTVEIRGRWLWQEIALLKDCSKAERLKLHTNGAFDSRFIQCLMGMPLLADLETGAFSWDHLLLTPTDVAEIAKLTQLVRLKIEGNLRAEDLLPLRANRMLHHLNVKSPDLSTSDLRSLHEVFQPCSVVAKGIAHPDLPRLVTLPDGVSRIQASGVGALEGVPAKEVFGNALTDEQYEAMRNKVSVVFPTVRGLPTTGVPHQLSHCSPELIQQLAVETVDVTKSPLPGNFKGFSDGILIDRDGIVRCVCPHPYHMDLALSRMLQTQ